MEFAAVRRRIGPIAQPLRRMIADLFEPGEKRQDDAAALDAFDLRRIKPFGQFRHRLLIQRGLAPGQRAECRHFRLVRQVGDDAFVGLEPAQNVGPHQTAQRGELILIVCERLLRNAANSLAPPSKPGQRKSNSDHKSESRFSMGVPLSAIRCRQRSSLTARLWRAPAFLIACASSRMARFHGHFLEPGQSNGHRVTGDDEVFAVQCFSGILPRRRVLHWDVSDGWA